jgi:hypothetical protein
MKPQRAVRLFLFAASLIVSACWCLTGDLDGIPAGSIPTVTPKPEQPTPLPTDTPEPEDERCNFFDQLQIQAFFHDVYPDDTWMTMYFVIPGGVPGLEIANHTGRDWVYTAELDDLVSGPCDFRGYAERLYCLIELPKEYHNAAHPLRIRLKDCPNPIFSHAGVSIMDEEPTKFDDIPPDTCGARPSSDSCNQDFADWCACKDGIYSCELVGGLAVHEVPVCILP